MSDTSAEATIKRTIDRAQPDSPILFDWLDDVTVNPAIARYLPNRVFFAHLAALIYDRKHCRDVMTALGFDDWVFIEVDHVQAVTAIHRTGYGVIIFEGTTEREDWFRNLNIWPQWKVIDATVVRIHGGFDRAGEALDGTLDAFVQRCLGRGLRVYVCGHSQGAALALRFAVYNPEAIAGVYCIALPRLGNKALARLIDAHPYYVVAVGSFFDSVTWTPAYPIYRHPRDMIYLDATRSRVTEVVGLRESWAVLIRWWYFLYYGFYFAGALLLNMWWELPSWWGRVRRLWRDHSASKHYAAQHRKLLAAAIERGELINDNLLRAPERPRSPGV